MNKITIAICEDNLSIQTEIMEYVSNYYQKKDIDSDVQVFSNGNDFHYSLSKFKYDLILMDIDLGDQNGMKVIENLRKIYKYPVQVVFITSYVEYKSHVLSLHTFDYILKPFTKDDIEKMLADVSVWLNNNEIEKVIDLSFKTTSGVVNLDVRDIIFFEYIDRKIEITTLEKKYIMYGSLKEIFSKIKEYGFASPHAAFLVNLSHIELLSKDSLIIMRNGATIPIAQTKLKAFRKLYLDYVST